MKNRTPISIVAALVISIGIYLFFPWQPKCAPYRNVTGYFALCNELNIVRNCAQVQCKGGSNTIKKIKHHLENSAGSTYWFANNQVITVADQNQVITQANLWATANKPAGYAIHNVKFIASIPTPTSNPIKYGVIDIEVLYLQCTGGLPN